jgi:hypothetical protein
MPNYFQFLGPNCPIGNGPVLVAIEAQADYILSFCDRWQTENIHSFAPKDAAVTDFLDHCQEFMKSTVWSQKCRSWYKSGSASGRVSALWPGSTLHYLEALREPRGDDWDVSDAGAVPVFGANVFSDQVQWQSLLVARERILTNRTRSSCGLGLLHKRKRRNSTGQSPRQERSPNAYGVQCQICAERALRHNSHKQQLHGRSTRARHSTLCQALSAITCYSNNLVAKWCCANFDFVARSKSA